MIIYKYLVPPRLGEFTYELPRGFFVVHVGLQDGSPYMWVKFDDRKTITELVRFRVFGTGEPVPPTWSHVGTFVIGSMVVNRTHIRPSFVGHVHVEV